MTAQVSAAAPLHPRLALLVRYGDILRAAWAVRHELAGPKRLADEAAFMPAALCLQDTPAHPAPRRVAIEEYVDNVMGRCPWSDPFYRHMYFHLKVSLPDDMLVKVDRMSMANGLETRLPFLDFRLVELMVGVHRDVKMSGYERKSVLRRTIGRRLPPAILSAPKKGFAVPLRSWFRKESANPILEDLRAGLSGMVDEGVLDQVIRDNSSGSEDRGNFLWMLALLGAWKSDGS